MPAVARTPRSRHHVRWLLSRVVTPFLYAALATLAISALQSASTEVGLAEGERGALAWLLLHRPSRDPDPRIALVAVDTPTFEKQQIADEKPVTPAGKPLSSYRREGCTCSLTVPRRCYAEAIRRLTRWGARVVVVDVMFPKTRQCPVDDPDLHGAIEQSGSVVLAAVANTIPLSHARNLLQSSDLQLEQPLFADVASVGSPVVLPRDREYAVELRQTTQNIDTGELEEYGAMAWEALCLGENRMPEETGPWSRFMVDGTQPRLMGSLFTSPPPMPAAAAAGDVSLEVKRGNVQVDDVFFRNHLLVNFSSGADPHRGRYPLARLSWLLSCSDAEGAARFHDRYVLLGNPATDRHRTLVGDMPGTEVLANALASILQRRPLRAVPMTWTLLLMFGLALACVALIRELHAAAAYASIALLVFGFAALSMTLIRNGWWLLSASPLACMALASGMAQAWESGRVQSTISKLAPKEFLRIAERAGGFEVQEGSVLFSDVRGYTTISETMSPAEVLTHLTRYMAGVDVIIRKYGGHFISCPGDCVVAWFGEERRHGPHTERAIRSGLEILQYAARFREDWRRDTGLEFAVGVGINSGELAVGFLQARQRMEATIIGDVVNTAARIESLTKEYGTFLVSEETIAPVRDRFDAEFVDAVQVKGRMQAVRLYRINGLSKPGAGSV